MLKLKQMVCAALVCGALVIVLSSQQASAALMFSDTPEYIGTDDAAFAQYTFGNRFKVESSYLKVTHLGYADMGANGLTDSHQVGLWTWGGTPTFLGSVTVASGTGETLLNGFRYHQLASPIMLQPGNYVLGGDTAVVANDTYRYGAEPLGPGINPTDYSRLQSAEGAVFGYPDIWGADEQVWGSVNMQYSLGAYPDQILSHNPIAYWRFEDPTSGNGDTAVNWSASGATHDGTYTNAGINLVPGPSLPSLSGNAASFNGGTGGTPTDPINFVDIPDTSFPTGNAARTWTGWLRTAGVSNGDYSQAFGYGAYSSADLFCVQQDLTGSRDCFNATQYGGNVQSPDGVLDGQWHFVAVTVEPTTSGYAEWVLYLDGEEKDRDTLATTTVLSGGARIAQMISGSEYLAGWEGEIDEVAIFATALNETDIANLYNSAFVPEPGSLVLLALGLVLVFLATRRRPCR